MKWNKVFTDAINERLILQVQYDSPRNPPVMIEPHFFGLRRGVPTLWAWDRALVADDAWEHAWLWLEHDRVVTAHCTGGKFGGARKGYNRWTRDYEEVYARI